MQAPASRKPPEDSVPITFEDRERGFESQFAHEAEFEFRLHARRDKLLARWAAAHAGMAEADGDALVAAVLGIADGPGHEAALLARIGETLALHRRALPQPELAAALMRCEDEARRQLHALPAEPFQTP